MIATSSKGDFTVGRLAQWIDVHPQEAQLLSGIQQAPDSAILQLARNIFRNDLVLRQADSAKITLDPKEMGEIRGSFVRFVSSTWGTLGVAPQSLADSAKSDEERERLAAARVEDYVGRLLSNQAQYVDIPQPVEAVLRDKYEWELSQAGLERAVARATKVRAAADSARAKARPPSAVPLGPQGPAGQGARHAPGAAGGAPSDSAAPPAPPDSAPAAKQP